GQSQLQLLQALDLVAQARRLLELEVASLLEHLGLELLDLADDRLRAHVREHRALPALRCAPAFGRLRRLGARTLHDVSHRLAYTSWRYAVSLVVLELLAAATLRLVHRSPHRARHPISIEDRPAVEVVRGAADRLDER